MRIDVITIFPEYFSGALSASLLGQAIRRGDIEIKLHDLRNWATDKHRSVDASPYGGGAGMVMRADVWFDAAEAVWGADAPKGIGGPTPRTVLLTPRGKPFSQAIADDLAAEPRIVLCCGRYEGIDERVHQAVATDEISVGDYVLAGGEAAALVVIEAVARLVPDVVGNASSTVDESFRNGLLEYPQYTRPSELRGLHVPDVLLSGDHAAVEAWRADASRERTRQVRPDLSAEPGPGPRSGSRSGSRSG